VRSSIILAVVACLVACTGHADTVAVNLADEVESDSHDNVLEVLATGVGTTPDKARLNAFANAIESAVGLMVDAETLVENDVLVSETVLARTRGFVQQHELVRSWEKKGLHYARIRAKVAVGKLAQSLKAVNIAVRAIPGDLLYRQTRHEIASEENAYQMLRKVLHDYSPAKLMEVTIVSGPDVVQKDIAAGEVTLDIRVDLTVSMDKWQEFYTSLQPILDKVATRTTVFSSIPQSGLPYRLAIYPIEQIKLDERLEGIGPRVYLLKRVSRTGHQTFWDAYRLPMSLEDAFYMARTREFELCIDLLDAKGATVWNIRCPVDWRADSVSSDTGSTRPYWIDPFFRPGSDEYTTARTYEETFQVKLRKLREFKSCAAYVADPASESAAEDTGRRYLQGVPSAAGVRGVGARMAPTHSGSYSSSRWEPPKDHNVVH